MVNRQQFVISQFASQKVSFDTLEQRGLEKKNVNYKSSQVKLTERLYLIRGYSKNMFSS